VDENPWIYESPDEGVTVYRRPWQSSAREIRVNGEWYHITELSGKFEAEKEEERLRNQYPALAEAYDTYRALLALCREENLKGPSDD
jgi:hypothetical protein